MRQTFQQEEAEEILQEAVRREVHQPLTSVAAPPVSRERLLAMAEELGITPAALEAVLHDRQAQMEREQEEAALARLCREFITLRRAGFMPHLYVYLGVNLTLLAINLLSRSDDPWFLWPLLFLSLFLYFHAIFALPTRGPSYERAFVRWRERRAKRLEKEAKKQAEDTARTRKTKSRRVAEAELDE